MKEYLDIIDDAIMQYIPSENCTYSDVIKAMKYSIQIGGKRVRPSLTLEFCTVSGGNTQNALPFACAIEMIHTYSLIHDDLPCMDDDDYRRGQKANHIVFGEDIALLAGDALQSLAFEIMLSEKATAKTGASNCARAAYELAKYCGVNGMVGGQVIDLQNENKDVELSVIEETYVKKTSALIMSACVMGCIASNANDKKIEAARVYGKNIGLAFQIVDDILDIESTDDILGKPTGSDASNHKSTFVSKVGIEKSKELVKELTQNAIDVLSVFDTDTSRLADFAVKLSTRDK